MACNIPQPRTMKTVFNEVSVQSKIMQACTGMILLDHVRSHLRIALNKDSMFSEDVVLQFAYASLWIQYNDAMKEYSEL